MIMPSVIKALTFRTYLSAQPHRIEGYFHDALDVREAPVGGDAGNLVESGQDKVPRRVLGCIIRHLVHQDLDLRKKKMMLR
jgi:hypothetical protein